MMKRKWSPQHDDKSARTFERDVLETATLLKSRP